MTPTQGAVVQFKGGLGRGDDPTVLHTGIVNGPTLSTNIVKVVSS